MALLPRRWATPLHLPRAVRERLSLLVNPRDGWYALNRMGGQRATLNVTISSFPAPRGTPYGLGLPVVTGSGHPRFTATQFITGSKYTILVIANPDTTATPRPLFSQRHPGGGVNQATFVANSAADFVTYAAGRLSLTIDTANGFEALGVVTGNPECYAIAVSGTTATMYRSGLSFPATTIGTPTSPWVSGQDTNLGHHVGSATYLENDILGIAIFDGIALPDALMRALTENPWPLFQTLPRGVIWAPASAGGSGDLAKTLDNVTLAATGQVAIAGTLAKTLANVTLSSAATLAIAGSEASTLADVTLSAAGAVTLTGSLSKTLGDVTLSAAGALAISGTEATTLADVTLSAAGTSATTGDLAVTLGNVTLSSAGTITLSGALAKTLADVTLSSAGTIPLLGSASITLDDCTIVAAGTGPTSGGATAAQVWGYGMGDGRTAAEVLLDTNMKVDELWREHGLDIAAPLIVTATSRVAGAAQTQTLTEVGGTVTVQRT
jgi:hypothetical protein